MAKLVLLNGERAGLEYPLEDGKEYRLGREEDCEILLRNVPGVSRKHAVFKKDGGDWVVEDLGSQNGIYVKKEKVARKVLEDKDVLWFSNASVRFSMDAPERGKNIYFKSQDDEKSASSSGEKTRIGDEEEEVISIKAPNEEPPTEIESFRSKAVSTPSPGETIDPEQVHKVPDYVELIQREFAKVVVGREDVLERILIALLSQSHCLMVGLPGLAKALMLSTLSRILDLRFRRIQFTSDLTPAEIIGSEVSALDGKTGNRSRRFIKGPIFTNLLLADKINRTPPKTQAALLEAMIERQVGSSDELTALPDPFFVLATQNPLDKKGIHPLSEAQLDRFMFNIIVDYPDEEDEEDLIVQATQTHESGVRHIFDGAQLLALQKTVQDLPVDKRVAKYATRLARSSRPGDDRAPDYIKENVSCGASPRAAQFLVIGAKARAILRGTLEASCDDIRALALPVLRHRIVTNSEDVTPDDLIRSLLDDVAEPDAND